MNHSPHRLTERVVVQSFFTAVRSTLMIRVLPSWPAITINPDMVSSSTTVTPAAMQAAVRQLSRMVRLPSSFPVQS